MWTYVTHAYGNSNIQNSEAYLQNLYEIKNWGCNFFLCKKTNAVSD